MLQSVISSMLGRRRDCKAAAAPSGTGVSPFVGVVLALPAAFSVETATLGRKPNNDGDNSGAMWFE